MQFHNKKNNLNFVQDGYLTLPPPKMINFRKLNFGAGVDEIRTK